MEPELEFVQVPPLSISTNPREPTSQVLPEAGTVDVLAALAKDAAARTGIGEDVSKRRLPMVATMAMGALSKQNTAPGAPAQGGLVVMLSQFLDNDRDGAASAALSPAILHHPACSTCVARHIKKVLKITTSRSIKSVNKKNEVNRSWLCTSPRSGSRDPNRDYRD
jgi:hypothetical protein